ncbi:MAG: MarR family transcriptional regulator [Alteromonadaceae bacterium]|nr:MarR family transcriptional regulator [Alteromonadaceae bacterium]
MTEDDLLKLDNQLCHRFYSVSNAFTRAYRPLLKELDITYPQYLVMLALWESHPMAISALVKKCRIDAGALTLILKKLQQKNLIAILPGDNDKRVKQVSLTDQGLAAKSHATAVPKQMLCRIQNLDKREFEQLTYLIDKLYCDLTAKDNSLD